MFWDELINCLGGTRTRAWRAMAAGEMHTVAVAALASAHASPYSRPADTHTYHLLMLKPRPSLPAGTLAGPAMLLAGSEQAHTSLALYVLIRGVTLLIRCGNMEQQQPWKVGGEHREPAGWLAGWLGRGGESAERARRRRKCSAHVGVSCQLSAHPLLSCLLHLLPLPCSASCWRRRDGRTVTWRSCACPPSSWPTLGLCCRRYGAAVRQGGRDGLCSLQIGTGAAVGS